jgi:hypothetical protein
VFPSVGQHDILTLASGGAKRDAATTEVGLDSFIKQLENGLWLHQLCGFPAAFPEPCIVIRGGRAGLERSGNGAGTAIPHGGRGRTACPH